MGGKLSRRIRGRLEQKRQADGWRKRDKDSYVNIRTRWAVYWEERTGKWMAKRPNVNDRAPFDTVTEAFNYADGEARE